jgi:hypothetical protein
MLSKLTYTVAWDAQVRLWQILSPSGHVLYESPLRETAERVRVRLTRRTRRRPARPMRPIREAVRGVADSLPRLLSPAISPAFG